MPTSRPKRRPLAPPNRMAPTDALFWYAESALPEFRPIIAGLYLLDRAPDAAAIEAGVATALARVPRLRQRVVEAPLQLALPEWVEDPHFDLAYHLRHLSVPPPGSRRQLLDLAGALFATPLDRERPLWEAWRIDGLEEGRSAFLLKLHHSVVDGVGSIAILDALSAPDPSARPRAARRARRTPPRAAVAGERLAALARDQAAAAARLLRRAAALPAAAIADPQAVAEAAVRAVRGVRGLLADATRAPLHDPLAVPGSGLSRRLDVAEVPLARLRAIRAALEVTINDVVLAALAGALRSYHRERGVRAAELACMVPMNLRGRDERDALGNRVGLFAIALPVGAKDPRERLARVVEQTRAAKADKRGAAAPLIVEALSLVPGPVFRWIARRSLGRVNVACTNVPGVSQPRFMAGARIEAIFPFASVVEGTPLVMALLSYAGQMEIGIDTDPEAIPDPHRIAVLFEAALDELEKLGAS